jgi:putative flippase GtrA
VATNYGIGYKTAMILLYAIGILLTFLFNRRWTFDHHGLVPKVFIYYILVYGLGYIFNLAALSLFVDEFGFPHQLVQGILIFVVAVFLLLLQRYGVFKDNQQEAI